MKMLMNKKSFKEKTFILLEGKTDIKLFRKLFDTTKVQLESLEGKDNVENVVKSIVGENKDRIIGLSDADFDHLNNIAPQLSIYLTDTHDTETLIINGVGIDSIIAEYATSDFHAGLNRKLLAESFSVSYEVGLLKLVNCRSKYNLCFKEIDFERFLTIKNLNVQFDQEKFIDEVIHHNHSVNPSHHPELANKIEELRKDELCKFMVCSGHDMSEVVSMIMSQKRLCIDAPISPSDVESTLRISYGLNDFIKTQLYKNLQDWSVTHNKVLFG
jgi:hypothetical protein